MPAFTNLGDLIRRDLDKDKLAIIDLGGEAERYFTYAELDAVANGVARALVGRGFARGERIAILSANRTEFIATVYGIMRAGLVAVPVNFRFPRAIIEFILRDAGARLVFCDPARHELCPAGIPVVSFGPSSQESKAVASEHPPLEGEGRTATGSPGSGDGAATIAAPLSPPHGPLTRADLPPPGGGVRGAGSAAEAFTHFLDLGPFKAVAARPDEAAMFLYTSGSTGTPKGVVLSHQSHIWVVETRLETDLSRHSFLIAAPLYHMNALALAQLACAAHATIVLLPQFSATAYIEAIGRHRCTWLTAVPPMMAMTLRERELLARTDLSSVEFVRMGSAPVSPSLMEGLRHALSHAKITNAYGTTEAGPVVFGPHPAGLPQPEMSVGFPHAKVQLRLVDESGRPADQGELEMKCPALMLGYHNRPELPPPITTDGFYRTGDVFRRDRDGFHYFLGRTDDMFVSGGENIYPGDVERMLERHPAVAQACVVPIADDIKGEKPVAFVIAKEGQAADPEDIKRFALANAPAYQHPRFVFVVGSLPLSSTNKIDRAALKRDAAARLAAERAK
jgi:acyl-CoA synthetase (AMP-forming)/AMP-acid ligase II